MRRLFACGFDGSEFRKELFEAGGTVLAGLVADLATDFLIDEHALEDGRAGEIVDGEEEVSEEVADDEAGLERNMGGGVRWSGRWPSRFGL